MPARRPRRSRSLALGLSAAVAAGAVSAFGALPAAADIVADPIVVSADDAAIALTPIGTFENPVFDEGAAEIVAHYGDRLYVVNADAAEVQVLDISDPTAPTEVATLSFGDGVANSVAVRPDGLGVVAVEASDKISAGSAVFFDARPETPVVLGEVVVGSLPDMVTVSPDGAYAVVANEGEPSDDFTADPEGTVSVIELPAAVAAPVQADVETVDFHDFEAGAPREGELPEGVRVFGPTPHGDDLPVSRNLEPEYITVADGIAYVALQEANAVAVIDLVTAEIVEIWALGVKDHSLAADALDASDEDGIDIRTFPGLFGMYQPDGILAYAAGGTTYLVTANEGDVREWGDYEEADRAGDLTACVDAPFAGMLGDADLGRLDVSTEEGYDAANECYSELYTFGGRSFSIWTTDGDLVFDSGNAFETITAAAIPDFFNSDHGQSELDVRSDAKGPEPENLAIGQVGDRTYAFIGLERISGIIVFDITDPAAPAFATYVNNRDFGISAEDAIDDGGDPATVLPAAGDLGPEGVAFIAAAVSPTGAPMLAVGNEVSGSTTLYTIDEIVDGVDPAAPSLPATGASAAPGAIAALVLFAVGAAFVAWRARRPVTPGAAAR